MIRLLYVDDEPDLLHLVRTTLEDEAEIEVLTASSAEEALSLIEREGVDVILSDYSMPRKNGLVLLGEVRRRFGGIPFVLFTGRGSEEIVIEALNGQADLFVRKQPDIGALLSDLVPQFHTMVARYRVEAACARFEVRYRAVFDHVDEGLILYDLSGRETEANEAARALLGPDIEESALEDLADRIALQGRGRFTTLVDAVAAGAPTASGRFLLANDEETTVRLVLKAPAPGLLLLVVTDVNEQEALEARTEGMERSLELLGSSLRRQIERRTLVIRGLTEQLSRSLPDRRDLALLERILVANEEIRSTVAYALRHQGTSDGPVLYRPLLPIVRRAARTAGMTRDAYDADCPEVSVSSDAWLERALHRLFADSVRRGSGRISVTASIEDERLIIRFEAERADGPKAVTLEDDRGGLKALREILADCPMTVREGVGASGGRQFELCIPAGGFRSRDTA